VNNASYKRRLIIAFYFRMFLAVTKRTEKMIV